MLACGPAFDLDFILHLLAPLFLPVAIGWSLLLALRVPGAVARHKTRRRLERGQCGRCGYDLRGSPDRCPECGTVRPGRAWNVAAWA
jgi:hypothetical protein